MNSIWFGSEASYREALASIEKIESYKSSHPKADSGSDSQATSSPYLSIVDGVGIITVQGSLYDATFGEMGTWFGVTGYGDIQQALVEAVRSPDVKSVLMVIKSGGGSVSGVSETATLIESVSKLKPVTAYSPSMMASAALWLGLAAQEVYVSDTAITGSIGTIIVLASRSRQLQADGIDAVVVRSGKYKALGNPAEPLSEEAIAHAQSQADYLANIFISYAADKRGVSKGAADATFGQGREFIGQQAVSANLVDDIKTYSQAFVSAKSKIPADNNTTVVGATMHAQATSTDNATKAEGTSDMKHIPTPEQLAAMAAGVDLSDVTQQQQAATGADATQVTTEQVNTEVVTTDSISAEAYAHAQAQIKELTENLATAEAKVASLTSELEAAKTSAESVTKYVDGMTEIVQATVKTMSLPLNLPTEAVASLKGEDLLAKHKEVANLFKSKIKAGGVAAAARETKDDKSAVTVNPLFAAAAQLRKGA